MGDHARDRRPDRRRRRRHGDADRDPSGLLPALRPGDKARISSTGRYVDNLVRTPDGWLFSKRQCTLDGWPKRDPSHRPPEGDGRGLPRRDRLHDPRRRADDLRRLGQRVEPSGQGPRRRRHRARRPRGPLPAGRRSPEMGDRLFRHPQGRCGRGPDQHPPRSARARPPVRARRGQGILCDETLAPNARDAAGSLVRQSPGPRAPDDGGPDRRTRIQLGRPRRRRPRRSRSRSVPTTSPTSSTPPVPPANRRASRSGTATPL